MQTFNKEDLENLRLCVASYRDKNDDLIFPELFAQILAMLEVLRNDQ